MHLKRACRSDDISVTFMAFSWEVFAVVGCSFLGASLPHLNLLSLYTPAYFVRVFWIKPVHFDQILLLHSITSWRLTIHMAVAVVCTGQNSCFVCLCVWYATMLPILFCKNIGVPPEKICCSHISILILIACSSQSSSATIARRLPVDPR